MSICPCCNYLNLMHRFLSNYGGCFPWAIRSEFFLIFKKILKGIFYEYFSFSLTWNSMRAKASKRYSFKSVLNFFKLLMNFLLNGRHKSNVLDFEFAIFNDFFSFSLIWHPMGTKSSKHYAFLKSL